MDIHYLHGTCTVLHGKHEQTRINTMYRLIPSGVGLLHNTGRCIR